MKAIDLDSLPYKHRFNGASLLISKANRLAGLPLPDQKGDHRKLLAALAYYEMALALMKPFDPNYSTVLNWKCNLLRSLGQYEDAVNWYREIVRISDETDGKAKRNATAALADEMIQKYTGRANEPLEMGGAHAAAFDDPPYCMIAEEFCVLLRRNRDIPSIERNPAYPIGIAEPRLGDRWAGPAIWRKDWAGGGDPGRPFRCIPKSRRSFPTAGNKSPPEHHGGEVETGPDSRTNPIGLHEMRSVRAWADSGPPRSTGPDLRGANRRLGDWFCPLPAEIGAWPDRRSVPIKPQNADRSASR
jgi:hypothetical protein